MIPSQRAPVRFAVTGPAVPTKIGGGLSGIVQSRAACSLKYFPECLTSCPENSLPITSIASNIIVMRSGVSGQYDPTTCSLSASPERTQDVPDESRLPLLRDPRLEVISRHHSTEPVPLRGLAQGDHLLRRELLQRRGVPDFGLAHCSAPCPRGADPAAGLLTVYSPERIESANLLVGRHTGGRCHPARGSLDVR